MSTTLSTIPSPKGIPLAGNAFQIDRKKFHVQFEKWAQKFGSIYEISVFGRKTYVISDSDTIKQILNGRPGLYKRRDIIEDVAKDMGINGVFTSEGALWKQQRKLVNEAFKTKNLIGFYPTIKKVAQRLCSTLVNHENEYINMADFVDRWALDISTILMFNYDLNSIQNNNAEIYHNFNEIFPTFSKRIMPGAIPLWKYLKLPKDRNTDQIMRGFRNRFIPIIQKNREAINTEKFTDKIPSNLLEGMLKAKGEDGYMFNNEDIFANVFSLLLAGKDAVTLSTLWVIYYVSKFPNVQEKIRAEVKEVVGAKELGFDHIRKLKYVQAVILETLRLKAIAPMISAESTSETEVMGMPFPAHSIFLLLIRIECFKDEYFSKAMDFMPERWLDNTLTENHCPRKSTPFGGGARLCSGNKLAVIEIASILVELCRNYHLINNVEGNKLEEYYAFLMSPASFKVKLTPVEKG